VEVAGVRVTSVPRTLADLLRWATREEALVAVESAVGVRRSRRGEGAFRRPGITMLHEIDDALGRASVASASGTKAALETLSMADPAAGSPAETVARLRMYEAGLRPCTQVTLVTPSGRRVRPDFLFVGEGLVVEIEGYRWHGSRAAHRDDVRRFNELQACREVRRVLRFTAYEVFHGPQRMLREIRQGLADLSPL
jgi:very-short-patch-repair endonuclease